jgi:hypothetical protein
MSDNGALLFPFDARKSDMRHSMQVLLVGLFVAAMAAAVQADIIAQHIGGADPTLEGFAQNLGTAGNAIDDNGTAAWEINSGKTRYIAGLSSTQAATLASSKWEMSGTFRDAIIPYDNVQVGIYMELSYGSGDSAKSYAITVGSRQNSPTEVEVMAGQVTDLNTGACTGIMNVGAFGDGYHTYKIAKEDAASDNVKFYVDGGWQATFAPTTGAGTISGLNRFVWGASASDVSMNADARWSAVSLTTTVPEPSTVALLATGLFGLLAYAWRKRK